MPKSDHGRFSAKRKPETVLRFLRGEDLDLVSREVGVNGSTLAKWRVAFQEGGPGALRSRQRDARDERIDELVERIRGVLQGTSFVGEGYRRVWARLRAGGLRMSTERVRRLMRGNGLSAPHDRRRVRGNKAHGGHITTDLPDTMWGTDATRSLTRAGTATIFILVDHCSAECIGIHAAEHGTRHEALEPLRQGVRRHFGGYVNGVATGLALRHDHGSQLIRRDFEQERSFLGIRPTAAFVASPSATGSRNDSSAP